MFENENNRTELGELGEFGLIKHIGQFVELNNDESVKGIGDDAAVIDFGKQQCVVSSDMLIEGVHFDLTFTPLKHLGYKAVVVNLSDIYSMNAEPRQITVNIAMSNRFSLEAVEEIYTGIALACKKYNVDLIGGDTSSSTSGLILSVTAIGRAKKEDLVYRSGAEEENLICVTGDLGSAYMGLQLLEREKQVYLQNPDMQPEFDGNDYILERQLKPEAKKELIEQLKELNIKPTSMIDISDGLASELFHICDASEVGCQIYEDKLPIDHQTVHICGEWSMNPITAALNGGEDYELLFTIPLSDYEKIKDRG
ncbi:MAG: thiamine-phosphate kinase, partial [Bacteroidia bacterium]|nr:thiamine-phosphate kinase [Bacteroidia bacterium]